MISQRKTQFIFNGESSNLLLSRKRVLQGSILNPILFNLYVAKLKNFISKRYEIIQFADDIAIFNRSSDLKSSPKTLKFSANQFSSYLLTRDFEVSPQKSSLVTFSRKNIKYTFPISIILNGITINLNHYHKFLEIILDHKLNGKAHIENFYAKCSKFYNMLKSLRGVWWDSDPRTLLNIYKVLIIAFIEYRSSFLPHVFLKKEIIQSRALKTSTLYLHIISNIVLVESGILSLKHRFEYFTSKLIIKSFDISNNPLIDKLLDLQNKPNKNSPKSLKTSYFTNSLYLLKNSKIKSSHSIVPLYSIFLIILSTN